MGLHALNYLSHMGLQKLRDRLFKDGLVYGPRNEEGIIDSINTIERTELFSIAALTPVEAPSSLDYTNQSLEIP